LIVLGTYFITLLEIGGWPSWTPEPGDGPDYDMIAYQLWQGKGFSYNWDDPVYEAPYQSDTENYAYLLERSGSYPTTYRPPLFPVILSVLYRLFGRDFAVVRLFNILLMAAACAIYYAGQLERRGKWAALIFALLFIFNQRLIINAASFLTESLAVFQVSLLIWALFRYLNTRHIVYVVILGLIGGLMALNRSIFLAWLLPICLLIVFIEPKRSGFLKAGLLSILLLMVTSPWLVRNIDLIGMPWGTHGGINLPAAYSDVALQRHGSWFKPREYSFFADVQTAGGGLAQEKAEAESGQSQGMRWIVDYWTKIPLLALYKVVDLWRPGNRIDVLILLLAVIGWYCCIGQPEGFIFIFILLINTLGVAATWSVGQRFLVPVWPVLYLFASLGTERSFAWVRSRWTMRPSSFLRSGDHPSSRNANP